jgi:hypothetical protein
LAGEFITHAGFKAAWWIYATFILAVGALYVTADTLLPKIGKIIIIPIIIALAQIIQGSFLNATRYSVTMI